MRAALDEVYRTFAIHPAPKRWDLARGRPRDLLAPLTAAPLHAIPCEAIGPYAGWAMTTVGDADHFKHVLPRLLELAVEGDCPHIGVDPPILASKLLYGGFADWPRNEALVVRKAVGLAWTQAISETPGVTDAEDWLCAHLYLGGDLDGAMETWLACPLPNAALQLAHSIVSSGLTENGAYWADLPLGNRAAFECWLTDPRATAVLVAALDWADDDRWMVLAALNRPKAH